MANTSRKTNPTDISVQIHLPQEIVVQVTTLKILSRTRNNEIYSQLLREALQHRGLLPGPEAAPVIEPSPTPKKKAKAQAPALEEATPPTLPTGASVVVADVSDEVAVADLVIPDVQNDEDVIDLDELLALGAPVEGAPTSNPFELVE